MKAAILGFGTVGSGVWKVLHENKDRVEKAVGEPVMVTRVLDLRDFPGHPVEPCLVKSFEEIEDDPQIDIVIECMGGIHPSYEYVSSALEKGKAVVTSNKELVASCGAKLMEIAYQHQTDFLFEASVGGGIPILNTLRLGLVQEKIDSIEGILNGTTNYILTRMEKEGLPYEQILKDAQALGYAEHNPEADVMGYDACRKIAILASMISGKTVRYEDIPTEGITEVSLQDIEEARKDGKRIRLVAKAALTEDGVTASVRPERIREDHPLAGVQGVFNAVLIHGNMVGDIMLEGQGAGKEATASAVVSDVIYALKQRRNGLYEPVGWAEQICPVNA